MSDKLIVDMEARLNTLEGNFRQAGTLADNAVRDIEDRFAKANPQIASSVFLGAFSAAAVTRGLEAGLKALSDFKDRLEAISETAKYTEQTVKEIFALQELGANRGIGADAINRGAEGLASKLSEAGRESNSLSRLFEANGRAIKGAQGETISFNQALEITAGLIQNAKTEADKVEIARLVGLSREWVKVLEDGPQAFRAAQQAAIDAAPDVQSLVDKAADFDAAWKTVSQNLVGYLKGAAVVGAGYLGDLYGKAKDLADRYGVSDAIKGYTDGILKPYGDILLKPTGYTTDDIEKAIQGNPSAQIEKDTKTLLDPTGPSTPAAGRKTVIPVNTRSDAGSTALNDFEREERRAKEQADKYALETRLIDANAETRAKALEAQRLEQMLTREGIPITDEYRAKIEALAGALGKAQGAFEEAQQAQTQFRELQSFAGQELIGLFSAISSGSGGVVEAFKRIEQAIASAVLQAAILGNGPLAGLFGTAAPAGTGGVGGLIGIAATAFKGFAAGGYTGSGATDDPAGIVHRGEFVFDAATTRRIGPAALEALRRGLPGYAVGGYVGTPTIPAPLSAANGNGGLQVIVNEAPGYQAETSEGRGPNGDPRLLIDMVSRRQAGDIASGRGPLPAAFGGRRLRG